MHPALKTIVADPILGRLLYALIAEDHHCVSRFGIVPYPTYDVDGDEVLMQEDELAAIRQAIKASTGLDAELAESQMGPAQVRLALPQHVHLPLLQALLMPEDC